MLEGKQIGVVVPAYNEEKLIGRVLETMPGFVDQIYVVDDCSSDKTVNKVRGYQGQPDFDGRLFLIPQTSNQGVGAAIATGYWEAVEHGMDVVAVMAGDAQMEPADLERVVEPVIQHRADYVKGNRLITGEAWHMIPKHRYLGNAFLSLMTKIASGYWHVADSQTGYTAISAETIRLIPLERLYPRYGYPNHLLVMLNIYNQRVQDIRVKPVYNIGEQSGIRLWRVIPTLTWLLIQCFFWRMKEKYIIRDFHPLVFFYLLALFLIVLSLPLGVRLVVFWFLSGRIPPINALALMFTGIAGLQSLFFAMWFDMENNKDLKGTTTS